MVVNISQSLCSNIVLLIGSLGYNIVCKKHPDLWSDFWDFGFFVGFVGLLGDLGGHFGRIFGEVLGCCLYSFASFGQDCLQDCWSLFHMVWNSV